MQLKSGLHNLYLKIFLCSCALLFVFSTLTQNAALQTVPASANAANVNAAARKSQPTPRPKRRTSANSANLPQVEEDEYAGNRAANGNYSPPPVLPANSIVRGRVFYADTGRPVKRAMIMLMSDDLAGGPGEMTGLTDGDGNFEIKKVRAGIYYAMVNAPGVVSPLAYADFSKMSDGRRSEKEAFGNAFGNFDKIVVDGVNDTDAQISARRGAAIGGRVMYDDGDAAIGVKIEVLRKVEGKFIPVIPNFSSIFAMMSGGGGFQTDDRGVYRFSGLPPGEYVVKATENTSHGDNEQQRGNPFAMMAGGSSFLTVFYPDANDTKSAKTLNLELGQEVGEINLTIPSRNLFKIEGKLVNRADKSPVRARVTLKRDGDEDVFSLFGEMEKQLGNSATDENGNWKFKDLPKGNYKIVIEPFENDASFKMTTGDYANANISANAARNAPPKPKLAKKIQAITIEDKDLAEIVIEMGFGATVAGSVTVENSREMPKNVSVMTINQDSELSVADGVSNRGEKGRAADNDFKLENVTEGKTKLYVSTDDDFYLKSATLNGADLLAEPFELKEGDNLQNVKIVLGKDVGTLKGKVLDERNEPLKNLSFTLVPIDSIKRKNSSFSRSARTDENGEFETKAAPREYAVVFNSEILRGKKGDELYKLLDEIIRDAEKVTVKPDETETVKLKKVQK